MRHRYHPLAEQTVQTSNYVIKELPPTSTRLIVEVGCGKGQFLVNSAINEPDSSFVGIEQSAQALYRAVLLAEASQIANGFFMWGDVDELLPTLPQPIDTLYLLFSDPWPKVRHEKRRLTTSPRLQMYYQHPVNRVILKTDNVDFYHYSLTQLEASLFHIMKHGELVSESTIPTEFEEKYRNLGKPIYFIEAKR